MTPGWLAVALTLGLSFGSHAELWQVPPQLQPSHCVIPANASQCELTVQLNWHSVQAQQFCLYQANHAQPLFCNRPQQQQINLSLPLVLRQSTEFELRLADKTVARMSLQVARASDTQLRRRRQFPWSL
ncbi:DUF3019 domain-containing protein [uncultured Ferrimonas sp.]|uniref:DUF3019 domain-containing protein n=1 Tax=uncultured Ferrimonas sp. TaxID=432640 RepID=UPI00262269A8|nr:DUF3019 domain-containing protein [uncultured Ferrimonas sp.]